MREAVIFLKNWLRLKKDKVGVVEILLVTALILVDLYKLYYTDYTGLKILCQEREES